MQEYTTYIFEKSKKKANKRLFYNLTILAALAGVIYMFVIGILGIGFTLIGAISFIILILQIKNYDDKYMGITAYGDRGAKFLINQSNFQIGDSVLPLSELTDLVIYVDEYAGMPREIFGVHHGGNNEITFKHKGQSYNFYYIIKNKSDYEKLTQLVHKIENKT